MPSLVRPCRPFWKARNSLAAGVERRQQGRSLVGLAAAATEEGSADLPGQHRGELLRQVHDRLGQVDRRRVLQRADLLADRLDQLRMAVAQGMHADAGVEVQVPLALRIVQVDALAAHDLRRVPIEMVRAGDQVLPLLARMACGPMGSCAGKVLLLFCRADGAEIEGTVAERPARGRGDLRRARSRTSMGLTGSRDDPSPRGRLV